MLSAHNEAAVRARLRREAKLLQQMSLVAIELIPHGDVGDRAWLTEQAARLARESAAARSLLDQIVADDTRRMIVSGRRPT